MKSLNKSPVKLQASGNHTRVWLLALPPHGWS